MDCSVSWNCIWGVPLGQVFKISCSLVDWKYGGVAIVQSFGSLYIGHDMVSWWPHVVITLSQIFIAASIGSRFHKSMFIGLKQTMFVAFLSTIGLIFSMIMCAIFVSKVTGIALITTVLAFAPGGIAEMTTTSVVLNGRFYICRCSASTPNNDRVCYITAIFQVVKSLGA